MADVNTVDPLAKITIIDAMIIQNTKIVFLIKVSQTSDYNFNEEQQQQRKPSFHMIKVNYKI